MEGGELLRPFGPRQIALKFSHVVGTFDAPLSQKGLEFWARHAGKFGRSPERQQAASVQGHRHFLRHLGLRRSRRQVDFLQNAIGNLKFQRHTEIITASAEDDKPLQRGRAQFVRGNDPLRSPLTHLELASTGPRSRKNGKLRLSSLSYFAHIEQEFLNQPIRIEYPGVLEGLNERFHLANGADVFASGEDSKGADRAEIHANCRLARWQIVEQKGKVSFNCEYDCLSLTRAEALAQSYQNWVFLHRNDSNPIRSNRFPDASMRCERVGRCIHFTVNGFWNQNRIKSALNEIQSSDGGKCDQWRRI